MCAMFAVESRKLFDCFLNTSKQVAWLIRLEQTSSIDIWEHHPLNLNSQFKVLVKDDEDESRLKRIVRCKSVELKTENDVVHSMKKKPFFQTYHSYDEIVDKINEWAEMFPDLLSVSSIGKSIENRDLIMLNITDKDYYGPKKVIWWNGGQHAREWISPAVVLYLAERLLKEDDTSEFLKKVIFFYLIIGGVCNYASAKSRWLRVFKNS
jgi:hypothetical protein